MCVCMYVRVLLFSRYVLSDFLWPHGHQHTRLPCPSLSLEFAQTHIRWFDDVIQPSHLLSDPISSCSQSFPTSGSFPMSWLFESGGPSIGASAQYFSFSVSPSIEYLVLISFRIDQFDLLVVQGTLTSLFYHHSLKASVIWHSAFTMVQLSHL